MSQQNLELARCAYDALNRRDLDTFIGLMHPEIQVESRLVVMEGGYRGLDGVRRWWDDFLGAFPDYMVEIEELRDLGEVTLSYSRGRGRSAGRDAPFVDALWQPIRWVDGKIIWWRVCSTEAEALEAAGLTK
jgi:hypothetical protein